MELFKQLLAEIEQIPAVDIHTHMRVKSPAAGNLSDIALYHMIAGELEAAGVDPRVFEIQDAKKRLLEASAGYPKIKNTSYYWCLTQILTDLYGAGAPHESDLEELWTKVEKTASDPGWPDMVFAKANVERAFVTCGWQKPLPKASDRFVPVMRVDELVEEAHLTRTLESLTEATGQTVYEASDLRKAIAALFQKAKEAGAVAAAAAFEPQIDFEPGDRDAADRILSLALLGQKPNREDRKALRSHALDLVLQNCAEHNMPFQLMLGIKHSRLADRAVTAYDPTSVMMYADVFARHSGAAFDVTSANETMCHELAVISRNLRNVYLSGYWWYLGFPMHIRKMIRERVEMLPMTGSCGFFSDAWCVEWLYAKQKLVRGELAFALADLVREGYLTEATAIETARQYLSGNPKRIYGV